MKHALRKQATALAVVQALAWAAAAWGAEPATQPTETEPAHAREQYKVTTERAYACDVCDYKRRFHHVRPWLALGADLRLRGYYIINPQLDKHDPNHEYLFQRHRARAWLRWSPCEDVDVNVRLMAEPRFICKPDSQDSVTWCEAMFDQLNVQWFDVCGLPLTLTVGRQDFRFGEGWLIADGTPLDGGRSAYFDAIRATYRADAIKTQFDLIYVDNHADTAKYIRPFNDQDIDIAEHDERGAIFYVSNVSVPNHTIDGYFVYRHADKVISSGWDSDLYTFGARVRGELDPWSYRAELAGQFGHKNGYDVCALGANSELAYQLSDAWKTQLRAQYEFRSGGEDSQNQAFDILWGRCLGSNLLHCYLCRLETVMGATSNYHRASVGVATNPTGKCKLELDYHLMFADENTLASQAAFSDSGCFRGQLVTAIFSYNHSPQIKSHLMLDLFCLGDYYSDAKNDVAAFAKYEITFSW